MYLNLFLELLLWLSHDFASTCIDWCCQDKCFADLMLFLFLNGEVFVFFRHPSFFFFLPPLLCKATAMQCSCHAVLTPVFSGSCIVWVTECCEALNASRLHQSRSLLGYSMSRISVTPMSSRYGSNFGTDAVLSKWLLSMGLF